jgi:hypothetical protein
MSKKLSRLNKKFQGKRTTPGIKIEISENALDKISSAAPMTFENGGKMGDIEFPNSNLWLKGFGLDKNGNYVVKVGFPNDNGFSIQTNGVLRKTQSIGKSVGKISDISPEELLQIEKEVVGYVSEHGSKSQKKKLKKYSSFEQGGKIKNQYKGKNPPEIWGMLTKKQRTHFLKDHYGNILNDDEIEKYCSVNDLSELQDFDIDSRFAKHVKGGQYSLGGQPLGSTGLFENGGKINQDKTGNCLKSYVETAIFWIKKIIMATYSMMMNYRKVLFMLEKMTICR